MTFIVVSGQPGSGKSTLAAPLASRLGLTLLAKDTIKEALAGLSDPGTFTIEDSRRLGAASFDVIFAIAAQSGGAVLEASWNTALAHHRLAGLPYPLIEVHCRCPPNVARQRYRARVRQRHWVHLDSVRGGDDDLWADPGPVDVSEPVIVVDTVQPVDLAALETRVRQHPQWREMH